MKHKILSLLVLLMTVATGAWAEESESITTTLPEAQTGSVEFTGTHFKITGQRADNDGMTLGGSSNRTITISALNGEIITKVEMTIGYKYYEWQWEVLSTKGNVSGNYTTGYNLTLTDVDVSEVTLSASNTTTAFLLFDKFKIFYTMPAGTMTLNTDNTVATMTMPANDVTVNYELVRDMTYQVNAYVGTTPDADYRHRVEKVDATTYWPVDITEEAQIIALFPVIDIIDAQNPKTLTYGTDYTLAIVDEQENEIDPADFDFAPGTYTVKVTGKGDYDGQIESLNKFELYFGYELTVGPGEFATFYKDEALTLDENETEAQLYTITAVGTETATATELTIAKANMPILVKNTSEEAKTILLIPTVDDADEVTVAPEFVGTLEATTIAASTEALNNYALNGKQFVWVMNAIEVAANKCWLQIPNSEVTARNITLVFGDATGVNGVIGVKEVNDGSWYDLNGRKLDKMPTKRSAEGRLYPQGLKKGVYILNGKKVVVK